MNRIPRFLPMLLVGVAMATLCGCTSPISSSRAKNFSWKPSSWFKKEYQEPVSMATIWKAEGGPSDSTAGQRGFGARVYFYNEQSQAIPVEGDLIVHGFLTTPSSRRNSTEQADKKFAFSSEQLASQYSPSDLGASYSIWIPWDEEGGFREEVTLIATFKSKSGSIVQGSPTRLFLPGKPRFSDDLKMPQSIQQVSYHQSTLPTYDLHPVGAKPSTRVTTIDFPSSSEADAAPEGISVGGVAALHTRTDTRSSSGETMSRYRPLPYPPQRIKEGIRP